MKIGVFGGTFNPIHYGHLRAAEEVREMLAFDKVLFVPSGTPPLKKEDLTDARGRFEMARLAIAGNGAFDVLDIESNKPEKKSYTVETLEVLLALFSDAEIYFILGIDAFLDIPNWWMPEKLVSMVNFAVLARPGRSFVDLLSSPYMDAAEEILKELDRSDRESRTLRLKSLKEAVLVKITTLDISSSSIRRSIREGLSIKYLLPENVESFIISHKLYLPVASRRESKRKVGKTFKK